MKMFSGPYSTRFCQLTRTFPLIIAVVFLVIPAGAAERQIMQTLVPADKLAEVRALTSPLPSSPEIVAQGKALYNGKGTCFNCHGKDGAEMGRWPPSWIHHLAISSAMDSGAIAQKAKSSG